MSTSTTSPGALVRDLFDALNRHDVTAMAEGWTAETVERFPDRTCRGPQEIGEYFRALFTAVPDAHMRIEALAEDGEAVFVRWVFTGTHTGGTFQGIATTGRRLEVDGIDHFTVRDGKIASNFVVFDQMQFGRQLGLLPPDGSAPDRALKAGFNALLAARAKIGR